MVHPLVGYHQGPFHLAQVGDGILCEDRKAIRGNQLRDTVVDFRVHMIGPACQHDAPLIVLLHPCQCFLTLGLHVPAGSQKLLPCCVGSHFHLVCGNLVVHGKFPYQGLGQDLLIGKGHEGVDKPYPFFRQLLHVVLDVLSIGRDHGAVVMVACIRAFIALIRNTGIENEFDSLLDEP